MFEISVSPNGNTNGAPHVPRGEAAQERVMTGDPIALGYKPTLPLSHFWGAYDGVDIPPYWEVLRRIPAMLFHPVVQDCLRVYKAGIYPAKFEVKASSQQAGEFALAFIRRFWSRSLSQAQLTYDMGWGGYEVLYEDRGGRLQFKDLMEFQPHDSKILTRNNQPVGVRVAQVEGKGEVNLWAGRKGLPAKGLWLTHNRQYHRYHGLTQCYGGYRPWWELASKNGLEDVIDGAIYRFGIGGIVVEYPPESETSNRGPGGSTTRVDMRDRARELGDNYKSGGTVGIPSTVYPDTKTPKWKITTPERTLDVAPLTQQDEYLSKKISRGIGVPPEMVEASDTGSGYSGRNVTKETFFVGQQYNATEMVRAAMEQIGSPLIVWNIGPGQWAEITVKPLLESQQQQSVGQPGMDGAQPGQPPEPGAPGAPDAGAPGQPGAQPAGKPDLAALLGKPQQMSLRTDGRWITVHEENGDAIKIHTSAVSVSVPQKLALEPEPPEIIIPAAITDVAKPDPLVEDIATIAAAGYKQLLVRCRKEILAAVRNYPASEAVERIEKVLRKYQPQLARLLADSGLASSLAGALHIARRHEANTSALPPDGAQVLEEILTGRPKEEQDALRAVVSQPPPPGEPPADWTLPVTADEPNPLVVFPVIEEAAADLASRKAMTREDFDALHGESRQGAFTVAGLATDHAVEKVRDAAAKAVAEGLTKKAFAEHVDAELGSGTFLSPNHMETVFRASVMGAYANGQDKVLEDPRVGDAFPYVARYTVDDTRRRPQHRAMEKLGIQGTNIYRRDDPTWQKFRAPWDYSCRCNDTYLTIRQAADRGIAEAIEWLRTGQPPAVPTFVEPPDFEPPPNWQRLALEMIGVQWLGAVMSSTTPGGHRGLLRPRDPVTHKIIPQAGGQPGAGAPGPAGVVQSDEIKVEEQEHKFASTQFNLKDAGYPRAQGSPLPKLEEMVKKIADADLAEEGRSDELHITALYGLHRQDPESVKQAVAGFGPVAVQLGKTSLFTGGKDGDVVKVDVQSPRLHELHKRIADWLPHTDKYPNYQPHITLAYVKPGAGEKYAGDASAEGLIAVFRTLVFSDTDGNKTTVELTASDEG